MSLSYNEALTDNVSRVRFHAGLTDLSAPNVLSDEAITGLVTLQGSWQGAVAAIYWRRHGDLAKAATSTTTTDGSQSFSADELRVAAERWDREAAEATADNSGLPLAVVGNLAPYQGSPGHWIT